MTTGNDFYLVFLQVLMMSVMFFICFVSPARWNDIQLCNDYLSYIAAHKIFMEKTIEFIRSRFRGLQWFQMQPPLKECAPLISDDW